MTEMNKQTIQHAMEIKAQSFATKAHYQQTRKYTGEAYISHPSALVYLLETVPHSSEQVQAAWLHDVVEDTDVTHEQIKDEFGAHVARIVHDLTDITTLADGNRKARKAIEVERLSQIAGDSQTVKLCDLIDNSRSIIACDPQFARVYIPEKRAILDVLTQGNTTLWSIADSIIQNWYQI